MNRASALVTARVTKRIASACWLSRPRWAHSVAKPPLVLVLDVDETLWRTHFPDNKIQRTFHDDLKVISIEMNSQGQSMTTKTGAWTSSRADLDETTEALPSSEILVAPRPGLDQFFEWVRKRRSEGVIEGPWIFTQGSKRYIRAVVSELDPSGEIFGKRILTREDCTRMIKPWPWVHKDLSQVACGEDEASHPERVVLVENSAMSGLTYPRNQIMVHDWTGLADDAPSDKELARVCNTLDSVLAEAEGEPGNYAERLARITPGLKEYTKALEKIHVAVGKNPPKGKSAGDAVKELWFKAVRAKTKLINQQPGAPAPKPKP